MRLKLLDLDAWAMAGRQPLKHAIPHVVRSAATAKTSVPLRSRLRLVLSVELLHDAAHLPVTPQGLRSGTSRLPLAHGALLHYLSAHSRQLGIDAADEHVPGRNPLGGHGETHLAMWPARRTNRPAHSSRLSKPQKPHTFQLRRS